MRAGLVIAFAAGVVAFGPPPLPPVFEVGSCSFDLLVGQSNLVVLAKVDRISEPPDAPTSVGSRKLRLAEATILETWKGKCDGPLVYRCSSSWTCDITSGTVGEVSVLLLGPVNEAGHREVEDAGRGRLPVSDSKGEKYATLWVGDVELPLDTETFEGPDERSEFIRNVKLDTLRSITKAMVARRAGLKEMVAKSDAVVVATVQRFRHVLYARSVEIERLAIEEVWKGNLAATTVDLRRPAAWPLDLERMQPGQRALFFLTKPREDGVRDLVEDGRGRMLVQSEGDRVTAKVWIRDVDVPPELSVEPKPGGGARGDPLWGCVKTAALKQFVADVH